MRRGRCELELLDEEDEYAYMPGDDTLVVNVVVC